MKRPACPIYVESWLSDRWARALSGDARSLYIDLLLISWNEDGIPESAIGSTALARQCSVSTRQFRRDWGLIRHRFELDSTAKYRNFRMERERSRLDFEAKRRKELRDTKRNDDDLSAICPPVSISMSISSIKKKEDEGIEPGAFQSIWTAKTGVLMPDASTLREARKLVELYAEAAERDPVAVAENAVKEFCRLVDSWDAPSAKTPALFLKHWDAIQQMLSGSYDPKAKKKSGRREEAAHQPPPMSEALAEMYGEGK